MAPASLKRFASSSTLNSCVLVCWYSSPGRDPASPCCRRPRRDDPAFRAVLGPGRNGVAEVLADDPFERLDVARPVEASEQIVERSVLESTSTTWSIAFARVGVIDSLARRA